MKIEGKKNKNLKEWKQLDKKQNPKDTKDWLRNTTSKGNIRILKTKRLRKELKNSKIG